jgi:shikimate kinase
MMQQTDSSNSRGYAPIFLIGFMGAGKTTVGGVLALQLEYDFLDLDELIAAKAGKPVQQIFAELGEAEFRRLEREAIRSGDRLSRTVVALGGGAYESEANRVSLRETGRTVWLDCPLEICLRRVSGDKSRPLLGDRDAMRELLAQRRGAYAEADYVVETGERAPEELALEIARLLDK